MPLIFPSITISLSTNLKGILVECLFIIVAPVNLMGTELIIISSSFGLSLLTEKTGWMRNKSSKVKAVLDILKRLCFSILVTCFCNN
ncbi:hypothetical protein T190611E02C_50152 [Tenacibaculum sp. 190524A05c]